MSSLGNLLVCCCSGKQWMSIDVPTGHALVYVHTVMHAVHSVETGSPFPTAVAKVEPKDTGIVLVWHSDIYADCDEAKKRRTQLRDTETTQTTQTTKRYGYKEGDIGLPTAFLQVCLS